MSSPGFGNDSPTTTRPAGSGKENAGLGAPPPFVLPNAQNSPRGKGNAKGKAAHWKRGTAAMSSYSTKRSEDRFAKPGDHGDMGTWANFSYAKLKEDDAAIAKKAEEVRARVGTDFRPAIRETYADRRGNLVKTEYAEVGGNAFTKGLKAKAPEEDVPAKAQQVLPLKTEGTQVGGNTVTKELNTEESNTKVHGKDVQSPAQNFFPEMSEDEVDGGIDITEVFQQDNPDSQGTDFNSKVNEWDAGLQVQEFSLPSLQAKSVAPRGETSNAPPKNAWFPELKAQQFVFAAKSPAFDTNAAPKGNDESKDNVKQDSVPLAQSKEFGQQHRELPFGYRQPFYAGQQPHVFNAVGEMLESVISRNEISEQAKQDQEAREERKKYYLSHRDEFYATRDAMSAEEREEISIAIEVAIEREVRSGLTEPDKDFSGKNLFTDAMLRRAQRGGGDGGIASGYADAGALKSRPIQGPVGVQAYGEPRIYGYTDGSAAMAVKTLLEGERESESPGLQTSVDGKGKYIVPQKRGSSKGDDGASPSGNVQGHGSPGDDQASDDEQPHIMTGLAYLDDGSEGGVQL